MSVAVIGLGGAGRPFAEFLSARGVHVVGYDLRQVSAPFPIAPSAEAAVANADLALAFTPASAASDAIRSVGTSHPGLIWVDFSTSAPKQRTASDAVARAGGIVYVEAAIMESVGVDAASVPVALGGPAAAATAELMREWGLQAHAVPGPIGSASARKLIRSIAVKGLTAAFIEATRAAANEGLLEWWEEYRPGILAELDESKLDRYLNGTLTHYARRIDELEAAAEMVERHGGPAPVARATVAVLRSIPSQGIPGAQTLL